MTVAGVEFYRSFREKEHIIINLKKQFKRVKFSFADNMIIYQYDDGKRNV